MGSCRNATRPASVSPTVRSVVPTGRRMNGSLMLTARSPRAAPLAGPSPLGRCCRGWARTAALLRRRARALAPRHPALPLGRPAWVAAARREAAGSGTGARIHLRPGPELVLPVHHHPVTRLDALGDDGQRSLHGVHLHVRTATVLSGFTT